MLPSLYQPELQDIVVKPTVQTSGAYTSGYNIDVVKNISGVADRNGGPAILRKVEVLDADGQNAALTLVFFSKNPTAVVDNTVFAPTAADLALIIGKVDIKASDYVSFSANSLGLVVPNNGGGLLMRTVATNIYMAIMAQDTPTYTAATNLKLVLTFDKM